MTLTDFSTTLKQSLDHILARLYGEPLLTLIHNNTPTVDRAGLEELFIDHVPSTVAGLDSGFTTPRSILECRDGENTCRKSERTRRVCVTKTRVSTSRGENRTITYR